LPAGGPAAWRPGRLASWARAGPGAAALPDTARSARGWQQRYVDGTSDIHL